MMFIDVQSLLFQVQSRLRSPELHVSLGLRHAPLALAQLLRHQRSALSLLGVQVLSRK